MRNRYRIVKYTTILLVISLEGCSTTPVKEVRESTVQQGASSSGKIIKFPAKEFSIGIPPLNWETVTEKCPPSVVAWQSSSTRSIIQIHLFNATPISHRGLAESVMHVLKVVIKEKDPQAIFTVGEEKEVILDGKTFYQVLADCDMSPVKGIQVKYKLLYYLMKGEKMDYAMVMIAVLGHYDQDKLIMDQIVRSFITF